MSFSELALQFYALLDQEQIDEFHTHANSVRIMADTHTTFLQEALDQLVNSQQEQLQLLNKEEVIFATEVIFNCAQEVSMDIGNKHEIQKLKKCVYLSKLVFEQNKAQVPLAFYSAFSIILLRFLEAIEISKSDEMQLVNQTIRQINFLLASNDIESQKIMTNLVRDVLARFYQTINKTTINIAIQFIAIQEDWFKLIELFSGKYFIKMTHNEYEITNKAFQAFNQHIQQILQIDKQGNQQNNEKILLKVTRSQQSQSESIEEEYEEEIDNSDSDYSNYSSQTKDINNFESQLEVLTNYIFVCLSSTHHTTLQITIPEYVIPFLLQTQRKQFHRIINALLQTGIVVYRCLAVNLAQTALAEKFVNQLTCIQIIEIILGICNGLSSSEESYFQIVIKFYITISSMKTNILCYPQHIENIFLYGKQKQFNKSTLASKNSNLNDPQDTNQIDITMIPTGINLDNISIHQFKCLYSYLCTMIYLVPVLIYISMLRLSTVNGIVHSQIQLRKAITEFYGSLHRNKILIQFIMTLLNQGVFLPGNKNKLSGRANSTELLTVYQQIHSDMNKEMQNVYTRIIQQTKFTYQSMKNILLDINLQISKILQNRFDQFLQIELLFRLSDESQQVKKIAAQQILDDIQENQYDNIGLLFTDVLQMINQETFLYQTFDQFILAPIYNKEINIMNKLLGFIEKSPFKLFESTFATFLKDRQVDAKVYYNLSEVKTAGSLKLIYYLMNYSVTDNLTSKQIQEIGQEMIANVINNHLSIQIKLYSLYIIMINRQLFKFVNSTQVVEQEFQQIFNAYQQQQQANADQTLSQDEAEIITELRNIIQFESIDRNNTQQIQNIANKYINQLKENYSLQSVDPTQFIIQNQHVLLNIAHLAKDKLLDQEAMEKLTAQIQKIVSTHPAASYPLTAFIYASDDIEFRLNVFEIMINEYNAAKESIIANNLLIGLMSCIYAYPDELGQFINLVLDNELLQTSFLMQRHLMYILCDLNKLLLIKLNHEAFIQMYLNLISPNADLQALADRLLLSQTQNSTYYNLFVQNFVIGMEVLIEMGVEEQIRAGLYGQILYKLPQTQKYQLINILLEKCTNVVITQEYIKKCQWFYNDVLGIIQSGAVQVAIQEEWVKAEKIVKKLNVQYSISAVLPKLFQILNISNSQQLQQLQHKAVQAIRAVSQQMKLTYQDLTIQFGDSYVNELIQVKW